MGLLAAGDAGFGSTPADDAGSSGRIVWHSEGIPIDDPQLQARVAGVLDAVAAIPGVQSASSPYVDQAASTPVRSARPPTPPMPVWR